MFNYWSGTDTLLKQLIVLAKRETTEATWINILH